MMEAAWLGGETVLHRGECPARQQAHWGGYPPKRANREEHPDRTSREAMPGISISLNTMAVLCLFLRKINKHHHQHERLSICLDSVSHKDNFEKTTGKRRNVLHFPPSPAHSFLPGPPVIMIRQRERERGFIDCPERSEEVRLSISP